jgi:hypothetical protein
MANQFRGLWRKHVVRWKESGLTQADCAERNGLPSKTLSAWVMRAKKLPASLRLQFAPTPYVKANLKCPLAG